jgi:hypothetical protein
MTPRPLDPSLAFTALLELFPGYRQMDARDGDKLTAALVADWRASDGTDMWAYAREWCVTAADPEGWDACDQQVTCRDCGRSYVCTPADDYYARPGEKVTGPGTGLCYECLIRPHGFGPDGRRV